MALSTAATFRFTVETERFVASDVTWMLSSSIL
jgi:hypothetical protein